MKRTFSLELKGKELFPLFIVYWIVTIAYQVITQGLSKQQELGQTGAIAGILFLTGILFTLFACAFQILFARLFAPKTKLGGDPFSFGGSVPKYLGMVLLGLFLSIITLGIYIPWFVRKIFRYIAGETSFKQKPFRFEGKGGKLLPVIFLTLLIPVTAMSCAAFYFFYRAGFLKNGHTAMTPEFSAYLIRHIPVFIAGAAVFILLMAVFLFLFYKWAINGMAYENLRGNWNVRFLPSTGFILLQVLFVIVTAGIAFPAAFLILYRYFAGKVETVDGNQVTGKVRFEGDIGRGFGLIWGQFLLSLITLGIYAPWAICKVGDYVLSATSYETVK